MVPARPALPMLMAVRIKGRATSEAIATAAGITAREARGALTDARAAGLVRAAPGGVPSRGEDDPSVPETVFSLTPDGHAELRALLAHEPLDHAALGRAYEAFLGVDARVKAAVTDWQLASTKGRRFALGATTLAATPRGTQAPTATLCDVGADAAVVADRLAVLVSRYAPYARRLATALEALRAGDGRYAASPRVDSLHQVWFELHQDLLLTLGRERGA